MKIKKIVRAISTIILIVLQLLSLILFTYALMLYNSVETFYRLFGILILIYLSILLSYLLLKSIKKKSNHSFIIPFIIILIIILIEFIGFYYLNKIYRTINNYSNKNNVYHTSLVTYDKSLNDVKDLKNKKIGLINDTTDIVGNIFPLEIIEKLNLKKNNTIKEFNSTHELLYSLKEKEIDAAFFSSNYIDTFSILEGFEEIENETKVLYSYDKEYESNEKDFNINNVKLNEPFTMLLVGVDSSKDGVTSGYNADVLLLVTFNPNTLRATLTSIPRDTYIKTACSNNEYKRINTTTWGSNNNCVIETVENLFDVDINYYAKINFKGVVELVNAVGGIDVDVSYSFCDQNSSRKWGQNTVYVKKGMQHLNGEQALALSRNRHKANDHSSSGKNMAKYCPNDTEGNRNDYTRGKNQMKVILGIIKAATKLKDPNQLINILETTNNNFQTNVKANDILSLYSLGKSIMLTNTSNLINIERLQLTGRNAWKEVYEPATKSYPAISLPYQESIDEIKKEININLGKEKPNLIKEISFDLNNLYEEKVIGSGNYSNTNVTTLKNLANMSISEIKEYAKNNNKELVIQDYDTKEKLNIEDYTNYYFHGQKSHVDTIIDQLENITIYVKKRS